MNDIFINSLNRYLYYNKISGKFVFQYTYKDHETYKVYKEYTAIIWFIKDNKREQKFIVRKVERTPVGCENIVRNSIMSELYIRIIDWLINNGKELIDNETSKIR